MAEHPVVVIEADASLRSLLQSTVGPTARGVADREALRGSALGASVVIFGPSFADEAGMAELGMLLDDNPDVGAVLVVTVLTTDILQAALRAGFRDVLAEPVERAQLIEAIERVSATLARPATPATLADVGERGRLITVFSTKGGAGKSMLATNVAAALAIRQDKPVVILDADLQFGDVSVMLKLAPRHTIVDAVNNLERLDTALLEDLLVTHPATGLRVLSAPLEPAFADQISAEAMGKVVDLLLQMAAYVVVDTPAYFNDVVLGLIEASDDVLLMAGMDIPNIKNVRIGLQTLRLLDTPMSKIRLVLNRANSKVKLDSSEVERTLQVEAFCRIPSDVAVPQSVNRGVPIVLDAPRSGPAKAIDALVKILIEEDA